MAIYPSHLFPFGAAFVCQAGNFWTLLRTVSKVGERCMVRGTLVEWYWDGEVKQFT